MKAELEGSVCLSRAFFFVSQRRKALLDTLLSSLGALERSTEDPAKYGGVGIEDGLIEAIRKEAAAALSATNGAGDLEMKDAE